jgi:hypothetical protein
MCVAGLAYCGAAAGYFLAGQRALGMCMGFYAASCVALLVAGSK